MAVGITTESVNKTREGKSNFFDSVAQEQEIIINKQYE